MTLGQEVYYLAPLKEVPVYGSPYYTGTEWHQGRVVTADDKFVCLVTWDDKVSFEDRRNVFEDPHSKSARAWKGRLDEDRKLLVELFGYP